MGAGADDKVASCAPRSKAVGRNDDGLGARDTESSWKCAGSAITHGSSILAHFQKLMILVGVASVPTRSSTANGARH